MRPRVTVLSWQPGRSTPLRSRADVIAAFGARDDMMPVEKQRRTAARLEADARDGGAPFECCVLRDTDHHVTAAHVGALFRWIDEAVALGARV